MIGQDRIEEAAALLHGAAHPVVLTGAGVSKESGIPTFRDALDGLWARYDPMELATREAFRRNPRLVWDFYEFRRQMMAPAQPNPAHRALVDLERYFPDLPIITQNVDDLHERAGSSHIIHLHGNIAGNKCFFDCRGAPTPVDVSTLDWDRSAGPPTCPYCGRWVRPDVVWFGEMLPVASVDAAEAAIARADVMLIIGTSGLVTPAANMPYAAKRHGAALIEINPFESELTPLVDVWVSQPAGQCLPAIVAALAQLRGPAE